MLYVVFPGPLDVSMNQETINLRFWGFPVVKSAYKTFLGELKFSIFFEKKISIFEIFFSENRKKKIQKNRKLSWAKKVLYTDWTIGRYPKHKFLVFWLIFLYKSREKYCMSGI